MLKDCNSTALQVNICQGKVPTSYDQTMVSGHQGCFQSRKALLFPCTVNGSTTIYTPSSQPGKRSFAFMWQVVDKSKVKISNGKGEKLSPAQTLQGRTAPPHDQGISTCLVMASPTAFGLGSCITQVLGTQTESILFSRGNVCPKMPSDCTRPELQSSREASNYAKERKRGSYTGSSILKRTKVLKGLMEKPIVRR